MLYGKRDPWSRKGDFGRALVIGGSEVYSGAPALVALSALRTGCDVVNIAAPSRPADIIASFSPALITHSLRGGHLMTKHFGEINRIAQNASAIALGNGAGRARETLSLFRRLFKMDKPKVIDADAIYAINGKVKDAVITPNEREFQALSGAKPSRSLKERKEQVRKEARKRGSVILLKGHVDVISDGNNVKENRTGSPYMTKGGLGDTLAGITLALLSRKLGAFDAAVNAARINGLAGALAAKEKRDGLLPTDLIEKIPEVIRTY